MRRVCFYSVICCPVFFSFSGQVFMEFCMSVVRNIRSFNSSTFIWNNDHDKSKEVTCVMSSLLSILPRACVLSVEHAITGPLSFSYILFIFALKQFSYGIAIIIYCSL